MEIKNLAWNENLSKRCNHHLLPHDIRGLIIGKSGCPKTTLQSRGIRGFIIGKSGCGKTTLLINLLLRPG